MHMKNTSGRCIFALVCDNLFRDTELLCHMLNYFFIVKLNAAFLSNLLADKATATAKLAAYSDYFKTHDETSQPIKVFIIHYNVIAHKIKTEI